MTTPDINAVLAHETIKSRRPTRICPIVESTKLGTYLMPARWKDGQLLMSYTFKITSDNNGELLIN